MEASTPVKPLDQAAPGAQIRAAGALPNLIVIGAQKCGTSVLHYYLSLHPEVSMSKPKELNFFIEERNWPRGVDWYKRAVRPRRPRPRRGLAQLHRLPPARGRARADGLGGPRREADLHGPRPARADRRALGPQLRQAPREGDAGRDPDAPEHLLRHPLASTRCSSSASSRTTRRSRSSSSSSPSCATSGWRRCARSSSSSASTPTSTTRASSRSATRPRARRGRPGSRCGSRRWAAAAAGGCSRRTSGSCSTTGCRCGGRSSAPTCAPRCRRETLEELRADAERLRELTGRDFSNWKIWAA